MSKLCILALLFYNIVFVICFNSRRDASEYRDSHSDGRFNLLDLLKTFEEKNEEHRRETTDNYLENWTGRWMPDRPGDPTPPPKVQPISKNIEESPMYVPMGSSIVACDNGMTNLTVDWDNSPVNYTCYGRKITPDFSIQPIHYSEPIPATFSPSHRCMSEIIEYNVDIPLFGSHRPVWPVYGEYKFLPKQRWLHSLEHGAVVMLYHPCANPLEVKRLKTLLQNCLRRHIISPYNLMSQDRPLVLLTWGRRFSMSYVNPEIVMNFIRFHSKHGPERIPTDGRFDEGLISKSKTVSDMFDTVLCPNM